jgi:hypothetical protein
MRLAVITGVQAANSLIDGSDYEQRWRELLRTQMETSVVNRILYQRLGNRGYSIFLGRQANKADPRASLRKIYQPSWPTRLLYPWARRRWKSHRQDKRCGHDNCECVWCTHLTDASHGAA